MVELGQESTVNYKEEQIFHNSMSKVRIVLDGSGNITTYEIEAKDRSAEMANHTALAIMEEAKRAISKNKASE